MLLKLQKYDLSVNYVKGKELHIADTSSQAQLSDTTEEIDIEELELPFTQWLKTSQSLTQKMQLQSATVNEQMQHLYTMIKNG